MAVDESKRDQWVISQERQAGRRGGHDGPLNPPSGDGTLPPMEIVDAKIAAAEARTDTKFAELRGDLGKIAGKGTVWGSAGALFLGTLAVLSFGGDRFDSGFSMSDKQEAQAARDTAQDAADNERDRKFDEILRRLPPAKR